jgi:hypothetical protein
MLIIETAPVKFWLKVLKRKLTPDGFLWKVRNYRSPSPQHVKTRILSSHSLDNAVWIETGTYLGDTTLKLSKMAKSVISIEPQIELSEFSKKRLKRRKNTKILNNTSEEILAEVLEELSGPTCFWLDGHYSGDITYKGPVMSPVSHELTAISAYVNEDNPAVVFIDDFRLFVDSASSGYPSHWSLVNWAKENSMNWTVEHDVFIAKSKQISD